MYSQTGLFGILLAVCVLGLLSRNQRKIKLSLPPGPTGLPIIGNVFDIPLVNMAQTYFGWAKEFGMEYTPQYLNSLKLACSSGSDIVYLEALGKKVIILNSYNVAIELLDRRSHIYSSRGVSILLIFVANIYPRINRPFLTFLGELYAFHILIILYTTLMIPQNGSRMAFCDDALRSGMEGTPTNFCSLLSNVKHRYPPTQRDSTHSPASSSSTCKVAKTIYGTYQTVRSYELKFQSVHADIHIV